jgi:hypothetical protein
MGQGHGYVHMTCGSSRRDAVWNIYYELDVWYMYDSTAHMDVAKSGPSQLGVD